MHTVATDPLAFPTSVASPTFLASSGVTDIDTQRQQLFAGELDLLLTTALSHERCAVKLVVEPPQLTATPMKVELTVAARLLVGSWPTLTRAATVAMFALYRMLSCTAAGWVTRRAAASDLLLSTRGTLPPWMGQCCFAGPRPLKELCSSC
jgi:hypothetical protein